MFKTQIIGSGVKRTERREVPTFTGLELAGVGTVRLARGTTVSLEVEADDNILPHLETIVEDETLRLRQENGVRLETRLPIVFTVVAPHLTLLRLSGAGDIVADDFGAGDALELTLSGTGTVRLHNLDLDALNVRFSGMGELELTGRARTQEFRLTGAGSVRACALEGEDVNVTLSGTGDVRVWATASLSAKVSGVGELRYRGEPDLSKRVTGIGTVSASEKCP